MLNTVQNRFRHRQGLKFDDLETVGIDGRRHYITPTGNIWPSVSTICGELKGDSLDKWRARVGEAEADGIATQAANKGTFVHKLCEDYINNKDISEYPYMVMDAFMPLKRELDAHLSNIIAQEACLWSDTLETAGRTDLVAMWDGVLSVVDFKTSRHRKRREWIENYFAQSACYCAMFSERFGIPVKQFVILMTVAEESEAQVFLEKKDEHLLTFTKARLQYREHYGR